MKHFTILLSLTLLLNACSSKSASDSIANSSINSLVALEKSLPANCSTDAIKTQINAIKTQINAITESCQTEKSAIMADKVKWQSAFFVLLIAICVFIAKRLIR